MGGLGSGRNPYATTATVGESLSLAAAELKELLEIGDTDGIVTWGDADDPRAQITVAAKGEATSQDVDGEPSTATNRLAEYDTDAPARWVRVEYTATPAGVDEPLDVDERIRVSYTPPPMGGLRPWFVCPDCHDRREELHLPPWDRRPGETTLRFRCRECHELGYETSRASGTHIEEVVVRYKRAFARADSQGRRPHPNREPHTPKKPSGRHERTHEEFVEDVERARAEWEAVLWQGLAHHFDKEHNRFEDANAEMFLEP